MLYKVKPLKNIINEYKAHTFKNLAESESAFSFESVQNGLTYHFLKEAWTFEPSVVINDEIQLGDTISAVTEVSPTYIRLANGTVLVDPRDLIIKKKQIFKVGSYVVTNHPDWTNIHGKLLLVIGFENDYYRLRNAESGKWVSSGIHMKFVHEATQAKVDNQVVKEFLAMKGYN